MQKLIPIGLALAGILTPGEAATRFASGPRQVSLLELYTSEGCSSCPRADVWLSRLKNDGRLWQQIVPVAFHVDYWDRLGWPDRFARREWTERQGRYAARWKSGRVYTPGFVLNGREWRGFFTGSPLPTENKGRPGDLAIESAEADEWSVEYRPATASSPKNLKIHLAIIGFGHDTDVAAGENRGRRLAHDFVIHQVVTKSLTHLKGTHKATVRTPRPSAAKRYGLAAWISANTDPTPIQATGGWLPSRPGTAAR